MTSEDQLPKSSAIMETPVQLKSGFHGFPEHLLDLLPEHLVKQLGILNLLLKEVQHNIQEHHNQVNSFLQQMEKCNSLLKKQTTELDLGWAAKELASPKLPQCATARSPQDPPDADPKSSGRLPQALRGDERPPPRGAKPQFWHDALTQELWRLFLRASHSEVTAQVGGNKVLEPSDLGEWEKEPEEEEEEVEVEEEEETMTLGKRVRFQTGQFYSHQPVSMVTKSILRPPKDSPQPPESQELPDATGPFLKPLTWDPEDFEDTWDRTAAEPGRSKRFAVPHRVEKVRVLNHGEPVLSAAVSSFSRHAFTCSKGGVKVWSLAGQVAEDRFPESHLRPGPQVSPARGYLRTCLLASDNTTLLAGGRHLAGVKLWDLSASSLFVKNELPCPALSCQSLAAKVEENLVLAGFSEGIVRVWDLRVHSVIRDISCPPNGARSLAVKSHKVWAGGLDACLRCWDLRMSKELRKFPFNSQIMSLCQSPQDDRLILGLANGQHWLQPSAETPACMVGSKGELILGVTFSPYGQWWASVGMDDMVTIHAMPTGAKVFQVPETSGINCCAVSSSNRLVVTGSQQHATVYQVTY